jgi:hypothetical protein
MKLAFLHGNIIGTIETKRIVKQCEFQVEYDDVNHLEWFIT